jgi:hypothetical protein
LGLCVSWGYRITQEVTQVTDDLDQSLPSTLIIFMQQMGIKPKIAARVVHQVPWVPTSDCQEPPF